MCPTQVAVKKQETRAAQLLREAQAEKAAADRTHTAAVERATGNLQRLDALIGVRQQKIASLEVRLVLPVPLSPENPAPYSRYFAARR